MQSLWDHPDFDDHEIVHFAATPEAGLRAIIAVHSSHRGPAVGGVRFWHYADPSEALTDVLRLSRGMSYKNAMADLPLGGGKAVILADRERTKSPELIAAYGKALDVLGGRYITAEDVGMTVGDMIAISKETRHVSGLPAEEGAAGGDPGPFTSYGVFLGIKAAVERALGRKDL
jgi:leucine dehydrogenase